MSELVIYGCGQRQLCGAIGWAKIPPPDSQFVYPSAILGDVQGGTNSSQGATGWTAALEGGFWPNTGKGWEDEAIQWDIFTGSLQIYCDTSLSCEKPKTMDSSNRCDPWILGEVLPKWLWQDPTEPTKGSVAWWYRAQPGASNGCDFLGNPGAIFLPAWDDDCPFEVVPEAGTMHEKTLVPLLVPA